MSIEAIQRHLQELLDMSVSSDEEVAAHKMTVDNLGEREGNSESEQDISENGDELVGDFEPGLTVDHVLQRKRGLQKGRNSWELKLLELEGKNII